MSAPNIYEADRYGFLARHVALTHNGLELRIAANPKGRRVEINSYHQHGHSTLHMPAEVARALAAELLAAADALDGEVAP